MLDNVSAIMRFVSHHVRLNEHDSRSFFPIFDLL